MKSKSWRNALSRTHRATFGRLLSLMGASELSESFWSELEASMIQADLGVHTTLSIVEDLKNHARSEGLTRGDQVIAHLRSNLIERLKENQSLGWINDLNIVILVGVNGSGKTTAAARLAQMLLNDRKNVLFAAADTFRAAASEQLSVWGERLGVEVIKGNPGSDPGAVVFDAGQASRARSIDVLIVDTSGRMHTEFNLMEELRKIQRVALKIVSPEQLHTYLVLDATTGQNGLMQANAFTDTVDISGVILAKLDSSAKGGVGFDVANTLNLPIQYVGLGEGLNDLAPLDPVAYVDGLLTSNQPTPAS